MTDSTNLPADATVTEASSDDLTSPAGMTAGETAGQSMASDRIQLAQAVVEVPQPNPGETVTITAAPGQTIRLGFDYVAAGNGEVLENGTLVLPVNGGEVVLEGFAAAATAQPPVELTNSDGTVIELGDFLVAIDVPIDVLIDTAAGGGEPGGPLPDTTAPNQGAGFSPGDGPQILGNLDPEGPVGPTALNYSAPEPEFFLDDLDEDDGGDDTPPDDVPDANDDGPDTTNETFCLDEKGLDGGEGGNGYDVEHSPTNGSAIRTTVTVDAGAVLTFKFNFLDAEDSGEDDYIDFAVVVIGDQVFKLSDVLKANLPGVGGEYNEQSGYLTFTYTFDAAGTYDIGFAVFNEDDTDVDSALLIDDVSISDGSFADGFETDLGNWDSIGNANVAGAVDGIAPTQGSQQALLDTDGGVDVEDVEDFFNLPHGTMQDVLNTNLFGVTAISDNVLDNDSFGTDGPGGIVGISYVGGIGEAGPADTSEPGKVTIEAADGSWRLEFYTSDANADGRDMGDYTFTLLDPIDHPAPGIDDLHGAFQYTIVDADGDTDTATLSICIKDDVPTVDIGGGEGGITLDETVDGGDDPNVPGGLLASATVFIYDIYGTDEDFGADGPGDLSGALTIPSDGTDSGLVDTLSGEAVLLTLESGQVVGRTADGGDEVFRISFDNETGNFTVTQSRALVHGDPGDPDEDGDPLRLAEGLVGFELTITDGDGDTDSDSIDLGSRIAFEDDGPTLTVGQLATSLIVDETNLAVDASASFAYLFTHDFGSDGPGTKAYALGITGAATGLVDTATGEPVTLQVVDGIVQGVISGGTIVFTLSVDADGVVTLDQQRAIAHDLDGGPGGGINGPHNDGKQLGVDNITLSSTVTDADGDSVTQSLNIGAALVFRDDGPTAGANAAVVVDDDDVIGADGNPGGTGDDAPANVSGTLSHSFGSDGGSITFLTTGAPLGFDYELSGNDLVVKQGTTTVLTVTLNPATGAYTVVQNAPIVHAEGLNENNQEFTFGYQVTDGDGDTATGSLTVSVDDDTPIAGPSTLSTVDEGGLAGGPVTEIGDIGVDFGSDGPGDVTGITGPAGLFSNGVAVVYEPFDAVTNTLTATAGPGGDPVFTVSVDPVTGEYTFTLSGPIDHGALENSKALGFGFTVTDGDGDPVTSSFTVNVADDVPATIDDTGTVQDGLESINLVIMFDRSRSMDEDPNVDGFSTRLDLARAAIASLMQAYDSIADVNILIVDFAGPQSTPGGPPVDVSNNSGWLTSVEEAIAYLAGLEAAGTTDYSAAVTETMGAYNAGLPAAEETVVYFLSDGNPTAGGDPATHQLPADQVTAWENFLILNGIDTAFAVGIGQGVTNLAALEGIAFPNEGGDGNPVIVTDEAQIFDTLLITVDGNASGNVIANDDFGADGPGNPAITKLTFGTDEYAFDGTDITKNGAAYAPGLGTSILVIVAAFGTLTFDFASGAYNYAASAAGSDSFIYTVVDGDGDEFEGTLLINVGADGVVKPNLVFGNDGDDILVTNLDDTRADILSGGDGDDHLTGDGSNDFLIGGAGADALFGGDGIDVLVGGTQSRTGFPPEVRDEGEDGADYLDGGEDDVVDYLFGDHGNDTLVVRTLDEAHGDQGNDLFVLHDNVNFGLIDGGSSTNADANSTENTGNVSLAGSTKGDRLTFDGSLDLSALDGGGTLVGDKITGIETISMLDSTGNTNHSIAGPINHFAAGADTLTLDASDVISMGSGVFDPAGGPYSSKDAIKIDGDANDTVNLEGGGWVNLGADASAPGYNVWAHDPSSSGANEDAYVLVSTSIVTVNAG